MENYEKIISRTKPEPSGRAILSIILVIYNKIGRMKMDSQEEVKAAGKTSGVYNIEEMKLRILKRLHRYYDSEQDETKG